MSRFSSGSSRAKRRGRPFAGMLVGVVALVALPAAIAWACVPASSIGFDKSGYKYRAGDQVKVTGRGFRPDTPVAMKLRTPSGSESVVGSAGKSTDGTGAFEDTFTLASNAAVGDYVVSVTVGTGGARETFTVEPAAAAPPVINPNPFGGGGGSTTPTTPGAVTEDIATDRTAVRAARRKAIRRCNKKFRAKKASSAAKRKKMGRKRAACVRKAKKRFP